MAQMEAQLGRLAVANDLIFQVIAQDPNDAEAQRLLSDLQSQIRQTLDTRKGFDRSRTSDPRRILRLRSGGLRVGRGGMGVKPGAPLIRVCLPLRRLIKWRSSILRPTRKSPAPHVNEELEAGAHPDTL